jgi:hypothetical protein
VGVTRLGLRDRGGNRRDVLGGRAAAAADDLRPFLPPRPRQPPVLGRPDMLIESPEWADHVAEIRIDPQGQLGEVAQPPDHPGNVVDRQAVDQ